MGKVINFLAIAWIGFILLQLFGASACKDTNKRTSTPSASKAVDATVVAREASKGLDLKVISALAKESKNAEDFETRLNSRSSGVNNLDLNKDGQVDFIKVTEFGSDNDRGFSLTTHPATGEEVELATITFTKKGDQVQMQTHGNQTFYGANHYHRSSFGISEALLLGYIFSNHTPYIGGWRHGHYPDYYGKGWKKTNDRSYTSSSTARYGNKTKTIQSSTTPNPTTKAVSPNAQKKVERAKSLTKPKTTQKSFSPQRTAKPTGSGGFGRTSSSSFGGRSSFGGGK